MTGRLKYIDKVAGLMIFWMILGHCQFFAHSSIDFSFYKYLGLFMPWFFYKSGMFYRQSSIKEQVLHDLKKLLLSFFLWSAIGWIVWSLCSLIDGSQGIFGIFYLPVYTLLWGGYFIGNGALWFLLTLFFVHTFFNCLSRKLHPLLISLLGFGGGYYLFCIGWYNTTWWFGNFFSGICFYSAGFYINENGLEKTKIIIGLSAIVYLGTVVASFCHLINFPYLYMHANSMNSGSYILFYPVALGGIILVNNMFRNLDGICDISVLRYIGVNSMSLYVTHWILMTIVTFVAKTILRIDDSDLIFLLLFLSCLIGLPLLNIIIKKIRKSSKLAALYL